MKPWNFKGGRKKDKKGYVRILAKDNRHSDRWGYCFEHIKIFEDFYKCCLLLWSNVHHINEIRDDNRIENLQGMTQRQHRFLHRKDMDGRICLMCGSDENTEKSRKHSMWYRFKDGFMCRRCHNKLYLEGMRQQFKH